MPGQDSERDKEYIGAPLSDQNYQDNDQSRGQGDNQEGNQQSGLGGEVEPGQPETGGDPAAEQESGGHGDKSDRRSGPTL